MYTIEDFLSEKLEIDRFQSNAFSFAYFCMGSIFGYEYGVSKAILAGFAAIVSTAYVLYLWNARKSEEGILRDLI